MYGSLCKSDHNRSEPRRARVYSIEMEGRSRSTAAASYGRVIPCQRLRWPGPLVGPLCCMASMVRAGAVFPQRRRCATGEWSELDRWTADGSAPALGFPQEDFIRDCRFTIIDSNRPVRRFAATCPDTGSDSISDQVVREIRAAAPGPANRAPRAPASD